MRKILLSIIISIVSLGAIASEPTAYNIFRKNGEKISYSEMIGEIAKNRVVFFGEMHNCPIAHWMEYEVTKSLYKLHGKSLVMGAEMFETDNQLLLDEFMKSKISESSFTSEARLWDNYSTDYVKLVDFAKENSVPFIATNVPRRYAQKVSYQGIDYLNTLSNEAKKLLPPLPIHYEVDSAKNAMFNRMTAMMGHSQKNSNFMSQAQAIKDATMAWNIAHNLKTDTYFLHFNGTFHSDNRDGIVPYLLRYSPKTSIATISSCRQENVDKLDEINEGRADYIICIPEDMTNSY